MHSKGAWNHSWRTRTRDGSIAFLCDTYPTQRISFSRRTFRSEKEDYFGLCRLSTIANAYEATHRCNSLAVVKRRLLPGRFAARSHSSEFIGARNAATRTRARKKQHSRATRLPLDEIGAEEPQSGPGTVDVLDNGSRGILVSRVTRPSAYHRDARTPEDSEGGGAAKVARLDGPKFRRGAKPPPALGRIVAPIVISMRRDAIGIATHRATSVVAADGRLPGDALRETTFHPSDVETNERHDALRVRVGRFPGAPGDAHTSRHETRLTLLSATDVENEKEREREYRRRRGG